MILLLLLSCGPEPTPAETVPSGQLLRQISLDLRGVLPSVEAMQEVDQYPETVDKWISLYLQSPEMKERWVHLFNEQWHTRIDFSPVIFYEEYYRFAEIPTLEYAVERAIMEEPLRLMTEVLANDLPWTTIVTADWTMANGLLAEVWPIQYSGEGEWQTATWVDGRPAAGILSTNGLWKRYYSTVSNMNRQRAAAISKLLLCEDYTARQIDFSQLDPEEEIDEAIRDNPYCLGCHSSLDPIAAALFGFYSPIPVNIDEHDYYHPEREALAEELLGVSPAWFGQPINGLNELGHYLSADPRFSKCAVESFASLLWKRKITEQDFSALEKFRLAFVSEGYHPHELIKSLVKSKEYQQRSTRILMPDQYASVLKRLTGFEWTWEGYDQMDNDTYGFRTLAGGVDGSFVLEPQQSASFTQVLTIQRLSEAAAWTAVNHDLIQQATPKRIFTEVELETLPIDTVFLAQLNQLHWQLYGKEPTANWSSSIIDLWESIAAEEGSATAWHATLSAMFQDPDLMGY